MTDPNTTPHTDGHGRHAAPIDAQGDLEHSGDTRDVRDTDLPLSDDESSWEPAAGEPSPSVAGGAQDVRPDGEPDVDRT